MSKAKRDEMQLRGSVLNLHLLLAHFKMNMNKPISLSPFCTPWCIVVFYFYCCGAITELTSVSVHQCAISEALLTPSSETEGLSLQFTRLSVCS